MQVRIGLACVAAAAWLYLLAGAGVGMEQMQMGDGSIMPMAPEWTAAYLGRVFVMWSVMMIAMMLPGAVPAILDASAPAPSKAGGVGSTAAALAFTGGYLAVWTGFSAAATLLQWALDASDWMSDAMAIRNGVGAGLIIVAIGLYQVLPFKQSCLQRCTSTARAGADRSTGTWASARCGVRYGASCLACCWALMCLLFAAGIMNLYWIAAITLLVSVEKLLPWRGRAARIAGIGLIAFGMVSAAIAAF